MMMCYTVDMSIVTTKVLAEALSLPEPDRARIAASLIESLEQEFDSEVENAWRAEVAHRLRELDTGAIETVDWVEARRMIQS